MDLGRGFAFSDRQTAELQVLLALHGLAGPGGRQPVPVDAIAVPGTGDERQRRDTGIGAAVGDRLVEWIESPIEESGPTKVQFTAEGLRVTAEAVALRGDRRRRYTAVRDGLLRWLDDRFLSGNTSPVLGDFQSSTWGHYMLQRFTDVEIATGTNALADQGLVTGGGSFGGGVARPMITHAGRQLVEHDGSVSDPPQPAGTVVTGGINQFNTHSPGARQTVTLEAADRDQIRAIAALLRGLQQIPDGGLDGTEVATVTSDLDEVATQTQPDRTRVEAVLVKARDAAFLAAAGSVGSAGGGALATLVGDHIQALLQRLGMG